VWLSEIMLQQTRVEAATPYYLRFLNRFPSIDALAAAPESDVLTAWSGLGYYSRARNFHRAAKAVSAGRLPAGHAGVLALPGIGPYTAAAICSIVLNLPHAAVDGNVLRVISRLTNDPTEISSGIARQRFGEIAQSLLDPRRPGDFNQAMMELGATVCVPRSPRCEACPVERLCGARLAGTERELPVKLKKATARDVELNLVVLRKKDSVFLVQRSVDERRLRTFWELPAKESLSLLRVKEQGKFTHRIVNDRFQVSVWTGTARTLPPGEWCDGAAMGAIPLTTITRKALKLLSRD
jgi:A/G-specific adenine glycosylase